MQSKRTFLGLDIGQKRIGLSVGDSIARLAQPLATLIVDGHEIAALQKIIETHDITDLVVGLPRNQQGETTAQTDFVRQYAGQHLQPLKPHLHWQDESVTSVIAEERLQARKKSYTKADIDAEAAAIILQDYLGVL